jgi:hypothetical protein
MGERSGPPFDPTATVPEQRRRSGPPSRAVFSRGTYALLLSPLYPRHSPPPPASKQERPMAARITRLHLHQHQRHRLLATSAGGAHIRGATYQAGDTVIVSTQFYTPTRCSTECRRRSRRRCGSFLHDFFGVFIIFSIP